MVRYVVDILLYTLIHAEIYRVGRDDPSRRSPINHRIVWVIVGVTVYAGIRCCKRGDCCYTAG